MNLQGSLSAQVQNLSKIPMVFWQAWPAYFTFAAVDYLSEMLFRVIPMQGGTIGTLERALINGAAKTIDMVTWDVYKSGGA